MAKTQKLREFIFHTIEQANNDIAFHVDQTNFHFRKRMFEMKRAREECDYQIKVVRDKDRRSKKKTYKERANVYGI